MKPKPPVPAHRWAIWYTILAAALVVFYGLFTPFWFGLRTLAWVAEFRSRRRTRRRPGAAAFRGARGG
ncbi:MAG: hypothetical protein ACJ77E_09845 [Gaiellaceae bacterium]